MKHWLEQPHVMSGPLMVVCYGVLVLVFPISKYRGKCGLSQHCHVPYAFLPSPCQNIVYNINIENLMPGRHLVEAVRL